MNVKNSGKYNSMFATQLRTLIEEQRKTIKAVADYIGVSRQAVSQYCDGSTQPNADTIVKIADYFGVDCDYLLRGTKTANLSISKELGLSDKAIEVLCELNNAHSRLDEPCNMVILNLLLENAISSRAFDTYGHFLDLAYAAQSYIPNPDELEKGKIYHNATYTMTVNEMIGKFNAVLLCGQERWEYAKQKNFRKICDLIEAVIDSAYGEPSQADARRYQDVLGVFPEQIKKERQQLEKIHVNNNKEE